MSSTRDAAEYLTQLSKEMKKISEDHDMRTLAYLFSMAAFEGEQILASENMRPASDSRSKSDVA